MSVEQKGNNHIEQTDGNKEVKKNALKQYLFVCSQNKIRSPAVASYFKKLIEEKNINAVIESAGTSDHAERKIRKDMVRKADVIFAMDKKVYKEILQKYSPPQNKLVNLDILDIYDFSGEIWDGLLKLSIIDEGKDILKRPEIKERLRFYEVLKMRKPILEKYIKLHTS